MEQVLNKSVNNSNPEKYFKLVRNQFKFKLFLLLKLPSAFFSGVMLQSIDRENCQVSVPYKWFSQNPFKSTYFACLSMAAELSTGALGLAHTFEAQPSISMLVVNIEGAGFKLVSGRILTSDKLQHYNSFENPDKIKSRPIPEEIINKFKNSN